MKLLCVCVYVRVCEFSVCVCVCVCVCVFVNLLPYTLVWCNHSTLILIIQLLELISLYSTFEIQLTHCAHNKTSNRPNSHLYWSIISSLLKPKFGVHDCVRLGKSRHVPGDILSLQQLTQMLTVNCSFVSVPTIWTVLAAEKFSKSLPKCAILAYKFRCLLSKTLFLSSVSQPLSIKYGATQDNSPSMQSNLSCTSHYVKVAYFHFHRPRPRLSS